MTVVDASIVVRLLQNRPGDVCLRERFERAGSVHAPTLIDAEVTSAIRGLLMTSKPSVSIAAERAQQMLDAYSDLPLALYPMQPHQSRVLALRHNFTAYDGFYVALAEALGMPLLVDDLKFVGSPVHKAQIETWT